eukprot:g1732.t1
MNEHGKSSIDVPVYTVDSFTSRAFSGNPAGVVLLNPSLCESLFFHAPDVNKANSTDNTNDDDEELIIEERFRSFAQKIASEINLSETGFLRPTKEDLQTPNWSWTNASRFRLNWFTPTTEVPLCGHGTLAAAKVLDMLERRQQKASNSEKERIKKKWVFEIINDRTVGADVGSNLEFPQHIKMTFPAYPGELLYQDISFGKETTTTTDELTMELIMNFLRVAGINELKSLRRASFARGGRKLILELSIPEGQVPRKFLENTLKDIDPNSFIEVTRNIPEGHWATHVKGVCFTCQNNEKTASMPYDFCSRYFAPWLGIPEDPTTGSLHCVLTPYYNTYVYDAEYREKLPGGFYSALQCSPRSGEMMCKTIEEGTKTILLGEARVMFKGTITLDALEMH